MSRRFFYRYICDVCDAELVSETLPPGWYHGCINEGTRDVHFCPEHGQEIRAVEAKINKEREAPAAGT